MSINGSIPVKSSIILLLTAIVCISFFSQSSFFYPFNEWCDANCYFNIGSGMIKGYVPYRDLYDQKGPLLYVIQAMGALVSDKTHIGIYFIEILSLFAFLLLTWKTLKECFESPNTLLISAFSGLLICSSMMFANGNCAEEFCLPLLALGLYLGSRQMRRGSPFTKKELYLLGICVGLVLWIKFTILGLYIGFFLFYLGLFLKEKRYAELGQMILYVFLGMLTVSAFVLGYAAATATVDDLFFGYFYQCLFGYRKVGDVTWQENIGRMFFNTFSTLIRNFSLLIGIGFIPWLLQKYWKKNLFPVFLAAAVIAALPFFLKDFSLKERVFISAIVFAHTLVAWLFWRAGKDSKMASLYICSGIGCYFFIFFVTRQVQLYYPLSLLAFLPFGFHLLVKWGERKKILTIVIGVAVLGICTIACVRNRNFRRIFHDKDEYVQYQFAKRIKRTPNASMLTYEVKSSGFYLAAEKLPPCQYGDPTVQVLQKEQKQMQDSIVNAGGVDFVVAGRLLNNPHYKLVEKGSVSILTDNGEIFEPRYLYQKIK